MRNLTPKQEAFTKQYLKDFNATKSAIRAGYSERSARSIASELLTKPNILAVIQEKVMTEEEVVLRLTDIARGNITDLMNVSPFGFTLSLTTTDEQGNTILRPQTKLIKKIKQKVTSYQTKDDSGEDRKVVETEIELYSAHEALRDIGKYHALFTDKHEITAADGEPLGVTIYIPDNSRPRNE